MKLSSPTSQRTPSTSTSWFPTTSCMTKSLSASASAITNARISGGACFSSFLPSFFSSFLAGGAAPGVTARVTAAAMLKDACLVDAVLPEIPVLVGEGARGRADGEIDLGVAPGDLSRLPAPKTTTAARGELRLNVDTEACDEKVLLTMRVRSELL